MNKPLEYIRLPFDLATLPDGWFNKYEVNLLYQLVTQCDGSVLEIGPWVGRSTCVICNALNQKAQPQRFVTIDYFFDSEDEWESRFGSPVRNKPNAEYYLQHINQPGGVMASLKRNLQKNGFEDLVDVRKGDFRHYPFEETFSLVFSDAMHGVHEIRKNISATLNLLKPGGILVCDDVSKQEEVDAIVSAAEFAWHHVDSLLFYGKLAD